MAERTCERCGNHNPRPKAPHCWRCKKSLDNAKARGTTPPDPFDAFECLWCGKPCVRGVDVVPHASRFCCIEHKRKWHHEHVVKPAALIASLTTDTRRADEVAYRRSMRDDPCAFCGDPSEEVDHIVPKASGGTDESSNRAGTCKVCNNAKQDVPLLIFMGWQRARAEFEPWRLLVAKHCTRA